jgi:hypothetical protein
LFHLFFILPRLIVGFRHKLFLRCGVVSPMPNPQPGGAGYHFSSGSSPLTCLAWEALPVAYATASIALGFMWLRKPLHYVKVGISSGGLWESCRNLKVPLSVHKQQQQQLPSMELLTFKNRASYM